MGSSMELFLVSLSGQAPRRATRFRSNGKKTRMKFLWTGSIHRIRSAFINSSTTRDRALWDEMSKPFFLQTAWACSVA